MKIIAALVIFAIIIAFSAGSAVAESNPLLTVFEGIRIGMKASDVANALDGYNKNAYSMGELGNRFLCCAPNVTDNPTVLKAEWMDPLYEYGKDRPLKPEAILTIELDRAYDNDAVVVKVTYEYKFLGLKKKMVKTFSGVCFVD